MRDLSFRSVDSTSSSVLYGRDLTRSDSLASTTSTYSAYSTCSSSVGGYEDENDMNVHNNNNRIYGRSLSKTGSLSRAVFTGVRMHKLRQRSQSRSRSLCPRTAVSLLVDEEITSTLTAHPFRISLLPGAFSSSPSSPSSPCSPSSAEWVMSGMTEEESQRWAHAIEHNCAVLTRLQCAEQVEQEAEARVAEERAKQWSLMYTAQAQMALSMVLKQARTGGGGKAAGGTLAVSPQLGALTTLRAGMGP